MCGRLRRRLQIRHNNDRIDVVQGLMSDIDKQLEADIAPPSKSQRKREMLALQDLGEALAALSAEQLGKMPLPERLREAVVEAQRLCRHRGALRRQRQYIGKLMRALDAAPIREALAALEGQSALQNAHHQRLERLRNRLLDDETAALEEILQAAPTADLQRLRALRRAALKEPESAASTRASRELFRLLRQWMPFVPQSVQADESDAD